MIMKKSTRIKMMIGYRVLSMTCEAIIALTCLGLAITVAIRG